MRWIAPLLGLLYVSGLQAQDRSTTPGGIVSIPYKFSGDNLKAITYKMKIAQAPEKRAYYYAMQFTINGTSQNRSGYTGIQPREAGNAKATFSIWGDVSSTSANCKPGADNETGVSCMVDVPFEFNNYYYLIVSQDSSRKDVWRGTILNKTTGKQTLIGEINVNNGAIGLKASHSGFIEYFSKIDSCKSLPGTSVVFDPPVDSYDNAAVLSEPYLYGTCKSSTQILLTKRTSNGYQIILNGS